MTCCLFRIFSIGTPTAICRTPPGCESTHPDGTFSLRPSLNSARFGNTKAQKVSSHDHQLTNPESGSRTDRIENRRLPQTVVRASSLLSLLPLSPVVAGPLGKRCPRRCPLSDNHTGRPLTCAARFPSEGIGDVPRHARCCLLDVFFKIAHAGNRLCPSRTESLHPR